MSFPTVFTPSFIVWFPSLIPTTHLINAQFGISMKALCLSDSVAATDAKGFWGPKNLLTRCLEA